MMAIMFRSLVFCTIFLSAAGVASAAQMMIQTVKVPGGIAGLYRNDGGRGNPVVLTGDGTALELRVDRGQPLLVTLPDFRPPRRGQQPGMLPDGEETRGRHPPATAWLTMPTERYPHGILGDAIEASGLHVAWDDGGQADFFLDSGSVFEDLRVRFADVDGDGRDELLVIRSYLDKGASLMVLKADGKSIRPFGETEPIGQPSRWLNPVGVADFDGDGRPEVALVTTPHIGGSLKLYEFDGGRMREELSEPGFSNHVIGSRVLDMALVLDVNNDTVPDILVPDNSRTRLMALTANRGEVTYLWELRQKARIVTSVLGVDLEGDGVPDLVYGLDDDTLVLVRRQP